MAKFLIIAFLLSSVLTIVVADIYSNLTCYHTPSQNLAPTNPIILARVSAMAFPGSQVTERQLMHNCEGCQKYVIVYNTMGLRYSAVEYKCLQNFFSVPPAVPCQTTVSSSAELAGTMASKTCICCEQKCNDNIFCTDEDPLIKSVAYSLGPNGAAGYTCRAVPSVQVQRGTMWALYCLAVAMMCFLF